MEVRYLLNGGKVGDGTRITRIWTDASGAQRMAIMVDPKTERFAEIDVVAEAPPGNAPPIVPTQTVSGVIP